MAKCINCGSEIWLVIERVGALETWRCKSCGLRETVHTFDPANEPLLPENLEPVFRVVGRWIAEPSIQQVSEIQASFLTLNNVPASALLRKAMQKSDIELGRFTKSEMHELEPFFKRVGMETTQIPLNSGLLQGRQ